jgi:hypothetical protein
MSEIRGLSVRQPWAWAITCAGKTVENRSRPTSYRGPLAIHASKTRPLDADLENPLILNAIADHEFEIDKAASVLGAIVAVAELTGCHDATQALGCSCSRWAAPYSWHWELANVRPLAEPVPCRGMLGLWRLPVDVEQAVRAQLEASRA